MTPFHLSMVRLGRVALTAAAVLLTAPAAVKAAPRITDVGLGPATAGAPLTLRVSAVDPAAPVTGIDVTLPDGSFAESACAVGPDGRPRIDRGVGRGRASEFSVPWTPGAPGLLPVTVRVTSGACGIASGHARSQLTLPVSAGDLVAVLQTGLGALLGAGHGRAQAAAVNLKPCAYMFLTPTAHNGRKIRGALACLINVLRDARGLPLVRPNARLRRSARLQTRDMLARGYFGHQAPGGPSFAERLRDVGYAPGSAGENIASGTGLLCTPYAVFVAWLSSSGHRENLLDPDVRDLGTAVAVGRPRSLGSGATYTTDLGVRH